VIEKVFEGFFELFSNFSGEGLMLYHPDSCYIAGRTTNLLKVKV
jgi:ATP-dependent DNA ligase